MTKTIIALTGASGVGKDFIAELILEVSMKNWVHMKFSKPMKDGLKLMLGLTEEQVTTDAKKRVIPEYGQSPQQMLETLGTDWAQDMVCQNIWATALCKRINQCSSDYIVISDLRGELQADFIRKMGGIVVHMYNQTNSSPGIPDENKHKIHDAIMPLLEDLAYVNWKNQSLNATRGDVMDLVNEVLNGSGPEHELTPVQSMQNQISTWADGVFPNRTITNALTKLVMEEIPEYLTSQHDPMELADCAILIFDIAHLAGIDLEEAMRKKMDINKKRTWVHDPETGLMNHVKKSHDNCTFTVKTGLPCPVCEKEIKS